MRNKQNLILIVIVAIIVLAFSISNYIKQQKVYVLSNKASETDIEHSNGNSAVGQLDNVTEQYNTGKIVVHIEGEIAKPGVYELDTNSRVFDAVNKAGGLLKDADRKRINLAKKIVDEEYIYIPNQNDEDIESQYRDNLLTTTNTIENTNLININSANIIELKELSGIGDVLANRIIDYRNDNGPFKSIEDLKNVSGIGDKRFDDIKDKITVK